ncbi:hypothetical protein PQ465_03785 [Sphingobacterium oryzagri]|uniref:Uncharacterized protein n=1 Tax=Sphingobacterium oryzagri TaxID=3025669 RepID=A0ABY7WIQ6_9SPHI|nr:hypothetical protein [Sphingobacterium sp. KACC 22765]WDF69502.1 hypothetical protein PQ465_03785 [Sphingobacterium sp. KACC 22765]
MENFLPALLIIGGVIYKIYSEYQKEQEKARRRRPHIPATPPVSVPAQVTKPAKPIVAKPLPTIPAQKYQPAPLPEEVKKVQEKRQQRIQKVEITTPELEVLQDSKTAFDLRQAVIQAAILERPYQ